MFALQGHMGRHEEIEYVDILNDPRENPLMDKEGVHTRAAKVYGL